MARSAVGVCVALVVLLLLLYVAARRTDDVPGGAWMFKTHSGSPWSGCTVDLSAPQATGDGLAGPPQRPGAEPPDERRRQPARQD